MSFYYPLYGGAGKGKKRYNGYGGAKKRTRVPSEGPTYAGRTVEQGGCIGYKTRDLCLAEEERACRWLPKKQVCANPTSHKIFRKPGSPKQVAAARTNPWLQHVKQVRAQNPNLSYKDALKVASETYVKKAK